MICSAVYRFLAILPPFSSPVETLYSNLSTGPFLGGQVSCAKQEQPMANHGGPKFTSHFSLSLESIRRLSASIYSYLSTTMGSAFVARRAGM